jgi:hypothetical protein
MLIIRDSQLQAFASAPRRRFEMLLSNHLRRSFPHECELGDVTEFVGFGIGRAEYHGCETELDIALYLNLMMMLGCDFDQDPQIPWAEQQLDDLSVPNLPQRLSRVYDSALEYLAEIGGAHNSHLVRAKLQIRKQSLGGIIPLSSDALPGGLIAFLAAIYPQKARRQGDAAMEELVHLACESANAQGARSNRSAAIHAEHMFILGSGYHRDPMYSWLNGILYEASAGPADSRFDELLRRFLGYVDVTLREQPGEQ